MNVVLLVGNLARDPELRYTPGGKAVVEFTVAVNEGFGEKRTTTFIRCQAWERMAESIAEQGRKGSKVAIEGRISVDTYTDKATQRKREAVRVTCRSVSVMGGSRQQELLPIARETNPVTRQAPRELTDSTYPEDDDELQDLPF